MKFTRTEVTSGAGRSRYTMAGETFRELLGIPDTDEIISVYSHFPENEDEEIVIHTRQRSTPDDDDSYFGYRGDGHIAGND